MYKIILLIDISEDYGKSLLKGVTKYSKENGPWIFCRMPSHYREDLSMNNLIKFAKEWKADGIIAQLYNTSDIKKLLETKIPVIVEDFKERFTEFPNITGPYFETGQMGAKYFINKGYKNFAFYGFNDIVWSRERAEGFEDSVVKHGGKVHFFQPNKILSRELWYYKPSALSKWLTSLPKPIAIMACDDERAQYITGACNHSKIKIPEEISVLGVDNDELTCNLSDPPLSSIGLDVEKGGYETAKLMQQLIENKDQKPYDIFVNPTMVYTRQSTDICATTDKQIAKALNFIHQNIENNINVIDVLKKVSISRRALEKRFLEVTGSAVYKYICQLRIEKFSNKLLESEKSINEIAIESGFTDNKNLSRLFKQINGCTPLQFRKDNAK
ncbi:MAG: DNA-binding transcriptional regulator [Flavobacterium sp.]|uniref:AraC family transcriptional regulator n=1 Tax=Flavobacterium sp. TaxID=239 RepID=UPI00262F355E|nr:DNA-binding transcriptional regulator [Flavobacterium sp.]MDD5150581.1 DNA-binding transcriptional regulator [Flavobacterium sp.]